MITNKHQYFKNFLVVLSQTPINKREWKESGKFFAGRWAGNENRAERRKRKGKEGEWEGGKEMSDAFSFMYFVRSGIQCCCLSRLHQYNVVSIGSA